MTPVTRRNDRLARIEEKTDLLIAGQSEIITEMARYDEQIKSLTLLTKELARKEHGHEGLALSSHKHDDLSNRDWMSIIIGAISGIVAGIFGSTIRK